MIVSDIFKIKEIPQIDGLNFSVSWPDYGSVRKNRYIMLEQAFETGDYRVGVSNGKEVVVLDANVVLDKTWRPEFVDHLFLSLTELTSVAFTKQKYAEDFVDRMEKVIIWKKLEHVDQTHN